MSCFSLTPQQAKRLNEFVDDNPETKKVWLFSHVDDIAVEFDDDDANTVARYKIYEDGT